MRSFRIKIPIRRSYRLADGQEKGRVSQADYDIIKNKFNNLNIGWKYKRYLRVKMRDTDNFDYAVIKLSGYYGSRRNVCDFLSEYLSKNTALLGESDDYWIDLHWTDDWTLRPYKN